MTGSQPPALLVVAMFALVVAAPSSVTSQAPPVWSLSEEPRTVIGLADGDSEYVFADLKTATTLSNGAVVIGDNGAKQLRFFDEGGRFLLSTGREGEGPGEFRWISWVGECVAESVFVFDPIANRVSVFDAEGRFSRSFRLYPIAASKPQDVSCNDTGSLLVAYRAAVDPSASEGPYRGRMHISLLDTTGLPVVDLGDFPGDDRYRFSSRSDGPRPLGKKTVHVIGPDRLYVGTADSFSVAVYDLAGSRVGEVSQTRPQRPISDSDIDRYLDGLVAAFPTEEERESRRRGWRRLEYPTALPAYRSLLLDNASNLWIEEYPRPGVDTTTWYVFDAEGAAIASLEVPSAFSILEVRSDSVLGRWTDSLGVDYLRIYSLQK